jgi:hypothetical protein
MEISRRLTGLRGPGQMPGLKPRRLVSGQLLSYATRQALPSRSPMRRKSPLEFAASNREGFSLCRRPRNDSVSPMRVEIADDTEVQTEVPSFPPGENFVDLRQNPHAIERVTPARAYLPLRNFLNSVNSAESVFATAAAATECKSVAAIPSGEIHEFGSRVRIVFAVPSLNFDRGHYADLTAGLKELLERDSAESIRGLLRVSSCDFPEQNRRGFCLGIQLVARGESAKQAELRWGLGLARVQQALLFRARGLGQQIGA